jgi:hypothetical protein
MKYLLKENRLMAMTEWAAYKDIGRLDVSVNYTHIVKMAYSTSWKY